MFLLRADMKKKPFVRLVELANNSNKQPVFPFILHINRNVNDKMPPLCPMGRRDYWVRYNYFALGPLKHKTELNCLISFMVMSSVS